MLTYSNSKLFFSPYSPSLNKFFLIFLFYYTLRYLRKRHGKRHRKKKTLEKDMNNRERMILIIIQLLVIYKYAKIVQYDYETFFYKENNNP